MAGAGLIWDLFAKDQASPAFLRVAGAADKAAASTERATKSMAATTARMGKVGASLTKKVTLPLLAIGAVSVAQAAKYQKSLNTIAVATGQTSAQLATTSKGLEGIAKSTGTNLDQLAASLYTAEKGGLRNAKALAVVKAAAQGAKAENTDLATATQALTSVMASYGSTLRDPVRAENEIIKGAGLAKTTMQDFASSLSNVVPIASSLGIGFDQVAGAIATMTQHGETAQRATENLANLITNLAGQNNVAAQALGQLGVNTIDLSKNLGKRGLTGSLNIVLAALAKHGKAGLIVTSAFKHSATAAASLRTELAHMPKVLQTNAKAFDSGKMSYKEFNAFAKSLGGKQYQMAKGFLATEGVAKGFNNQLKNGNSTTRTLASTLQKALGGVTGMRVALMLSGQSADTFAKSTKAVKKAAGETKGDVLGWATTQNTLSVKVDKAKASLQVMAVEVGTALLPVIGKLVDLGSKAVHWFDGLSGTQKKVLGWSLGIMAALGPILSIGGRLATVGRGVGKFAASAATKIASLAGASEATATRVGSITRGMVGAVGGILAGAAAAQIGGNGGGGWLASVILGAAGGGALGGLVGAAVGGVSAAIFKGVGLWNDHKNAAKQAAIAEKAYVDSLTQSINTDNGALGNNLKLSVEKALQSKGVLDQAQKLGVSLADVVSASMGSGSALSRSIDKPAARLAAKLKADLAYEQRHPHMTESQAAPINAEIQALNKQIQAYGRLRTAITGSSGDVGKAKAQYAQTIHALDDSRVATGRFASQLAALRRTSTVAIDANGQLNESLAKTTPIGQHNRAVLTDLSAAALADANSTFAAALKHHDYGRALQIATGKLGGNIKALEAQAKKAGFNKKQTDELITSLHLYSGLKPSASLHLNTGPATDDINAFIASLPTITVTAKVQAAVGRGSSTYGSQVPGHATGGGVNDGYFTVGERGWELGHKRGSKVDIYDNKTSQKMTGMSRVPGYSGGTKPKPKSKPKPVYSYGGIDYASKRAADNAAARDAASKRQDIVQGGASAIAALLAAAHNIMSTGADLRDAAKQMRDAAKAGLVSADMLARFAREGRRLTLLGNRRDRVAARLGTAPTAPTAYDRLGTAQQNYRDERSTVRGAITGSFDITSAGGQGSQYGEPVTLSGIRSQLARAVANARRFTRLLKKLGREGLNRTLLSQLAAAGPSALPQAQALASATPKQLASINSQFRSLNAYGGSAGKYMADQMYGAGVNSAQALVNGLRSKESALTKAIRRLAEKMVKQLRTSLGMHSPSKVLFDEARLAFRGYENGIQSKHGDIARAAGRIGGASVPGRSGRAFGDVHHHYNIDKPELHVHYPLEGDLQEGVKQLARMLPQQIRAQTQGLDQ